MLEIKMGNLNKFGVILVTDGYDMVIMPHRFDKLI